MRYALLVCGDENVVSPEDEARMEAAFALLQDELRSEGILLGAERLRPASTATTVQVGGGDVVFGNAAAALRQRSVSTVRQRLMSTAGLALP